MFLILEKNFCTVKKFQLSNTFLRNQMKASFSFSTKSRISKTILKSAEINIYSL